MFFILISNDIKSDVLSKRITEMKMVDVDTDVIKSNRDAYIYETWRPIVYADEDYFVLETKRKDGDKTKAEGYYSAFNYYDGVNLRSDGCAYVVR